MEYALVAYDDQITDAILPVNGLHVGHRVEMGVTLPQLGLTANQVFLAQFHIGYPFEEYFFFSQRRASEAWQDRLNRKATRGARR